MVNVGTISQQVLHVKGDIVFALESVARGSLPPDGIMSREMITLYIFMLTMSVIALKPCRVWLYKVLDTCVALLLLGLIGAVVLGIPFGALRD